MFSLPDTKSLKEFKVMLAMNFYKLSKWEMKKKRVFAMIHIIIIAIYFSFTFKYCKNLKISN